MILNPTGGMLTDQYAEVGAGEKLISINTIMPEPNEKFTWEIDWTETRGNDMPVKYKLDVQVFSSKFYN